MQFSMAWKSNKNNHVAGMPRQQVQYRAVEDYNGACCPLSKGLQTFFRTPCTEEPRIPLSKGETILATRGTK